MVDSLDIRVRLLEARTAQLEAQKTQRAIAGIGRAAKDSNAKQKESSSGMLSTMKSVTALAAGAGVYEFFKQGVSGALNLQQSMTVVNNSLAQIGVHSKEVTNQLKDQAEAASQAGGGTTEEELQGLSQFIQQTQSLTQAQNAQTAANRLARGSGMQYAQAQQLVTGALAGRTRGLQRYIGIIQPVTTAEDALARSHGLNTIALENQAKAMGKAGPAWLRQQLLDAHVTKEAQAQAAAQDKQATAQQVVTRISQRYANAQESTRQRIQDLRHSFENLTTNLATALLPTINRLIKIGTALAGFFSRHKTLAEALAGVITVLAVTVISGKLVRAISEASRELRLNAVASRLFGRAAQTAGEEAAVGAETATVGWELFASATLIGLLIPAIMLVVTHFNTVKNIVNDVIHFITGHWKIILSILTGPVGAAIIFIVTHFNQVKHAVSDVVRFLSHIAGQILHWLEWPFVQAWNFIKTIPSKIGNIFKHIPLVGGLLHAGGPVHRAMGGPIYRQMGGASGTDVVPAMLSPGEYVLNRSITNQIGVGNLQAATSAMNVGGVGAQQPIQIRVEPMPIQLDGRVLAQSVLRASLNRAARGSSSLVGGALATTGGYTTLNTGARA